MFLLPSREQFELEQLIPKGSKYLLKRYDSNLPRAYDWILRVTGSSLDRSTAGHTPAMSTLLSSSQVREERGHVAGRAGDPLQDNMEKLGWTVPQCEVLSGLEGSTWHHFFKKSLILYLIDY